MGLTIAIRRAAAADLDQINAFYESVNYADRAAQTILVWLGPGGVNGEIYVPSNQAESPTKFMWHVSSRLIARPPSDHGERTTDADYEVPSF